LATWNINRAPCEQALNIFFRKMGKVPGDLFKMVERKTDAAQKIRKGKRAETAQV